MVPEAQREHEKPIDREKTCPLLLRVFCSNDRHHALNEFSRGSTPSNELQMYTWQDATLKELEGLVKEVNPEARRRGTYFDFALVYPDLRQGPRCQTRDVGTTISGQKGPDDTKTLQNCKFVIGDFIDIAVTPPTGRMDRMDYGRRGFGGDRRNGFGGGRGAGGGGGGGYRGD